MPDTGSVAYSVCEAIMHPTGRMHQARQSLLHLRRGIALRTLFKVSRAAEIKSNSPQGRATVILPPSICEDEPGVCLFFRVRVRRSHPENSCCSIA